MTNRIVEWLIANANQSGPTRDNAIVVATLREIETSWHWSDAERAQFATLHGYGIDHGQLTVTT